MLRDSKSGIVEIGAILIDLINFTLFILLVGLPEERL